MALETFALVTLANTKIFLGITNSEKDTVLEMLINMASQYIEEQTGRRFISVVHTEEEYDGTGTHELNLTAYPVITFTKLEYNSANDNSDDWEEIDSEDYWVNDDNGIVSRINRFNDNSDSLYNDKALSTNVFTRSKNKYRATYTSGYSTIPYDLQFACMSLAGQLLNTRASAGINKESLGDHSIEFTDIIAGNDGNMFKSVINKYREIPLA